LIPEREKIFSSKHFKNVQLYFLSKLYFG